MEQDALKELLQKDCPFEPWQFLEAKCVLDWLWENVSDTELQKWHMESIHGRLDHYLFNYAYIKMGLKPIGKCSIEELEQACISGGEVGVELARDSRYKENHTEVKEELSVEEKAKRYDEAIKIAKDSFNYPDYPGFIRADVVFPELKESEHEKIRKELIQYLKDYPTNLPGGQYCRDDFFKWLEKQKEQEPTIQPIWSEEDEKLHKLSIENLTELMHRFGEEYGKVGDCINWLESTKDRFQESK